jgi:dihydroorotate dehydrogenase electron transfer subunit
LYQQLAPVISNREIMPDTYLLWAEAPELAAGAQPGQFVMVSCDRGHERLLRRPLSIYRTNAKALAFLFAVVGAGTAWLAERRAGEKIDLLGPLGNGFNLDIHSTNLLLVAGGMGIAPLCFLAQKALQKDFKVRMLIGARTACRICPEQLIPEGCRISTATEDGTAGMPGMITDLIPSNAQWADQVAICGPLPMLKTFVSLHLDSFKNRPAQASLEVRMGCGLGFCYACTIGTRQGLKQVCKDGPVFNMADVIWDELK